MTRKKKEEGSQFGLYFGPLLDALRGLGGSGSPDEVVSVSQGISSSPTRFKTNYYPPVSLVIETKWPGRASTLSAKVSWIHQDAASGA